MKIIDEFFHNKIKRKLDLDEIRYLYTDELDKIIISQEKENNIKFIAGSFKVSYFDENYYDISFDLYFQEGNNTQECIMKSSKTMPLNSENDLKPEAIQELREKKIIVYEIKPPSNKTNNVVMTSGSNLNSYNREGDNSDYILNPNYYFNNLESENLSIDKIDISALDDSKIDSILKNFKKIVKYLKIKIPNSEFINDLDKQIKKYEDYFEKIIEDKSFWKIAVVGAFSCGKSSFINSIIDEEIEPVDITPVNHANSIFTYGDKLLIKSVNKKFTDDEYKEEVKKLDSKYKEFLIEYPCETLKNIKLYDTPGFGSVNKGDVNKTDSDIELSKLAANEADTVFYLVDITNGTIDEPSLNYIKEINGNNYLYVILTHSDKKSPKARETIKETITKQLEKVGFGKINVFLYSSLKEKYENDPIFARSRGRIETLVQGFYTKQKTDSSTQILLSSKLIGIYNNIKNKVNDFIKDEENKFYNYLEKKYLWRIEQIVDDFLNKNPNLIIKNKGQLFYHKIKEKGWFSDTYWVCVEKEKIFLKNIRDDHSFNDGLNGVFSFSSIIKDDFCVIKFNYYKKNRFFISTVYSNLSAERELKKVAKLIQNDYTNQREELKKIILNHFNWKIIQENYKSEINKDIEGFNLSWKELNDILKDIETQIKS